MTDDRIFDLAYSFGAAFECDEANRWIVDHAVGEAVCQIFEPMQSDAVALRSALRWSAQTGRPINDGEMVIFRAAFFGALAICRAADPEKESR